MREGTSIVLIAGLKPSKRDSSETSVCALEFDFLVINESRQFILNIEVKHFLGPIEGKTINEDPRLKAATQLFDRKKLIEDLFGAELQGQKWNYVKAVAYESDNSVLDHDDGCSRQCEKFVAKAEKMTDLIQAIEEELPIVETVHRIAEDFKCLTRNLLYCLPAQKVMVTSCIHDAILNKMDLAGSKDNILLWMPTPAQRNIFAHSDSCKKIGTYMW